METTLALFFSQVEKQKKSKKTGYFELGLYTIWH